MKLHMKVSSPSKVLLSGRSAGETFYLPPLQIDSEVVSMGKGLSSHNLFSGKSSVLKADVCYKYFGVLGDVVVTTQRGSFFPLPDDVKSFRMKIQDACPSATRCVALLK